MPLVKPALANATAGQPVTAQAWNAILSAIGALYDAVLAIGAATLDVELRDGGTAVTDARVVAVPASGAPIVAVPPRAGGTAFTLTGLANGAWTIYVDAPGYQPAQLAASIPASGATTINLTSATVAMPDLIGTTATAALAALTSAAIGVELLLDTTGEEVSKTALPADRAGSKVLFQLPLPGQRVVAANARTRLVLSATADVQIATVPNFVGMSYSQLVQAISAAGLKLGNVTYGTK